MMAKPVKTLELHRPMIQFLINSIINCNYLSLDSYSVQSTLLHGSLFCMSFLFSIYRPWIILKSIFHNVFYFLNQVCELEEKIVNSVQDTLKLIELGNKLRLGKTPCLWFVWFRVILDPSVWFQTILFDFG